MNCATAREHLLSERPDASGVAAHLTRCAACRSTQRRLARLHRDLPGLAVPSRPAPPALLARVLLEPDDGALVRPRPPRLGDADPHAAGRQKLALAFAMAASLLVFAVGWALWQRPEVAPTKSPARAEYDAWVVRKLPRSLPPRQRVERLTGHAEELFAEAQKANPARLDVLAQQFEHLSRDLLYDAATVPTGERKAVGEAAERLRGLESEAAKLAVARRGKPEERALVRIALAVRQADERLRALA